MKKLLLWCLLPLMVFGQNMLKNTGFEEKGENGMPVNWGSHCTGGSTAGMTTETSYSGQACGYIVKIVDGKSHVAAITQGRLAVEPETEYLLTAMAKGNGTLFGYEYDANGKWLRGSKSVAVQSEDWVPISTRFKTSKDTKTFEVRFELFGKEREGKGWVDDVRFGTPQPQPQPPQNLVAKYDPQAKTVKLSWTALEGMRYYVSRSRYPDNANTMVHASNLTSGEYEDKDVPKDWSRVFYRLTAVDEWNQRSEPTGNVEVLLRATNEKGRVVLWTDSVMNKYRRYAPPREDEAKPSLSISLAIRETEARQIVVYA
ncbi:MAG: carbohydrate binding domain-containing protein, partial [Victivallales bacterium]|nr:carbohydrate binding domain-containing protein [Victivallales bacterium]